MEPHAPRNLLRQGGSLLLELAWSPMLRGICEGKAEGGSLRLELALTTRRDRGEAPVWVAEETEGEARVVLQITCVGLDIMWTAGLISGFVRGVFAKRPRRTYRRTKREA